MDDRILEHADTLVDWSARIAAGDAVVVEVGEGAHDLGVAVARALGDRGASMLGLYDSEEMNRAYLRASTGDFEPDPRFTRELFDNADAVISLRGTRNVSTGADIPSETRREFRTANEGVREARYDTDWVSTVHPTRALAQQAGMSYEAYCDFVYGAIFRDWQALADEMAQLKTILDEGSEVHIEKGAETDLWMDIEGRTAVNSAASVAFDSHNLPSGEVFTAPTATEGTVVFDVPMTIQGSRLRDVRLTFEDGEVIEWSAAMGEEALTGIIETDAGARRLGELGIGMNRGIDRVTDQILFDEKMAGTVHLALGRAYDACLPEGETGNESAVHTDLITDMRTEDSTLSVDGEVIQADGIFRWEDEYSG